MHIDGTRHVLIRVGKDCNIERIVNRRFERKKTYKNKMANRYRSDDDQSVPFNRSESEDAANASLQIPK